MTDDTAQSESAPTEPAPASDAATSTAAEPAPPSSEPMTIAEQAAPAEPISVIQEESQSAQEKPEDSGPMSQPISTMQVPKPSGRKWNADDRAKSAATKTRKKDAHLAKIVEYVKAHDGKITNDEIEKLLHVSDATASRYTKTLVARGVLRKEGKGRGAKYILL